MLTRLVVSPVIATIAGLALMLPTPQAAAIAPGHPQARLCRGFTANKYNVTADQVNAVPAQRTPNGYYINWSIPKNGARGYCFVSSTNHTTQFVVERGPLPGTGSNPGGSNGSPVGYSARVFYGIPGYESGLRVKLSDYQDIPAEKRRYFLVKNSVSTIDFRWYGNCSTEDQIYDGQKYLGYNPNARALLAYACMIGGPPVRPQPR